MLYIRNENRFSRSSGSPVVPHNPVYQVFEGTVLVEAKDPVSGAIQVRPYVAADTTAKLVSAGLALESNVMPAIGPQDGSPFTVGQGFDYTRYNRGGLIASIQDALVDIDTQNGLITVDDTYAMDGLVYWDPTNLVFTVDPAAGANLPIGVIKNWTGTNGSAVTSITVKINVLAS